MAKSKKENYREFLKDSRDYFIVIGLLFIIAIAIGYLFPIFFTDYINNFIEQVANQTKGMGYWRLFLFILQNNAQTSFIGLIFGVFLGIVPLIFVLFNGYVIGFVVNKVVLVSGASTLWRLLPHGIFEIPALIISLGLGLRLGMFILNKKRKKELASDFINSMKVFLYVVIPLLIIAALIEAALIILFK